MPANRLAEWYWLETALVSGDIGVGGHDARSRIFAAVSADRGGRTALQLLAFTNDPRSTARRAAFDLLSDLCAPDVVWAEAAEAAERALGDVDEVVRRAAAWSLVAASGSDRVVAALDAAVDPAVRVALAEAMALAARSRRDGRAWSQAVVRLRFDEVPAVRLLANLEALRAADAAAWPELDAVIYADLKASEGVLGALGSRTSLTGGERWALVLARLDREEDCYAWAERLAGSAEDAPVKLAGVALALEAIRTWRAGPARLATMLAGLLTKEPSAVRSAAVRTVAASLTATRLSADHLAVIMTDPQLGAVAATALGCIGDRRAAPQLARLMYADDPEPRLAEALAAVARAGAAPVVPVAAARQVLATHRDPCRPSQRWRYCPADMAMHALAAFGPAAADAVPELIARILAAVERDVPVEPVLEIHVLERIGPAAAAAIPVLQQYANGRGRSADLATRALLMITSDRAVADRYLAERPEQLRRCRIAPMLLTWLVDHGGLTDRQRKQLRHLFGYPGAMQVRSAGVLWRSEGPPVADELLEQLPQYLDDDVFGPEALRVLAAMGPYARPVLDHLDQLTSAHRRVAVYLGNPDAEMRADEQLLAATEDAHERIAERSP
ncbi:hypothetical protein ACQEVC_23640 [Plantactinospora sp. CA-294935]|uniref:hypothetical protein n=1 Tax=Plantactinospora sp. CA-294935 TaxID=3240012 RepID=UPI003D91AA81